MRREEGGYLGKDREHKDLDKINVNQVISLGR